MTLREKMQPLFDLHHARRPVLVFGAGVSGNKLVELLGIPVIVVPDCDWLLMVGTQERLDDLVMGVRAVFEQDGSFPDFSAWREQCLEKPYLTPGIKKCYEYAR